MAHRADPLLAVDHCGPDVVLARVAHAMRDTLHALLCHAELLAAAPLAADQRRHAVAVHARAAHLRELVAVVLDGAALAGGGGRPRRPAAPGAGGRKVGSIP